ncbi:MAG: phosphoribosylformimino-5-aminoimidazole carboxamide ribotide isomerase [Lachnospiraceae bacterium]|nr:phosphoribosylformimino-5-aminoimidazole carboxamide ribotide isomerase [Lachnospiraceae bacterium]
MRFRPCIDIHNGKVKQIVGGSLRDQGDTASENFVSGKPSSFYADIYRKDALFGGHVILLNPPSSPYFEKTKEQALQALAAYPQGLQLGGGVTAENAQEYLDAGASHVIVTSYVFRDGQIHYDNLERLVRATGKEHLVLDLSCRRRDGEYYIVTDRWQNFTDVRLNTQTLDELSANCDDLLIPPAYAEGKAAGIELAVAELLGCWRKIPVTYAGGVGRYEDLKLLRKAGENHVDVAIGSALDLFGGSLSYRKVLELCDT